MTDVEAMELQRAHMSGLWAFNVTTTPNSSGQPSPGEKLVMRASVPPWFARPWTINLNAMRFAQGTLLFSTFNPDNQVGTASPWKVRVRWGTSNASEQALVDYMPRGSSFTVYGSDVNVWIQPNATTQVAQTLSGFLTPCGNTSPAFGCPTFTTSQSPVILPSGQRIYTVPDRAIAYRWHTRQEGQAVGGLTFTQLDNAQADSQFDMVAPITLGAQQEGLQGHKAGWIPLNPATQFIRVFNNDATNAILVGLQFLLDLG